MSLWLWPWEFTTRKLWAICLYSLLEVTWVLHLDHKMKILMRGISIFLVSRVVFHAKLSVTGGKNRGLSERSLGSWQVSSSKLSVALHCTNLGAPPISVAMEIANGLKMCVDFCFHPRIWNKKKSSAPGLSYQCSSMSCQTAWLAPISHVPLPIFLQFDDFQQQNFFDQDHLEVNSLCNWAPSLAAFWPST